MAAQTCSAEAARRQSTASMDSRTASWLRPAETSGSDEAWAAPRRASRSEYAMMRAPGVPVVTGRCPRSGPPRAPSSKLRPRVVVDDRSTGARLLTGRLCSPQQPQNSLSITRLPEPNL
eukprot:scaffold22014_cov123-Isochrysis_galbana.AAC.1